MLRRDIVEIRLRKFLYYSNYIVGKFSHNLVTFKLCIYRVYSLFDVCLNELIL